MDENIKVVDLSHLSERLVNAARDFVDLKFKIDTEGRSRPNNIPDDLHGPMSGGEWGPYSGKDFFINIMPFLPRNSIFSNHTIMAVPVSHTLGDSWRLWPDPNISSEEKEKVISYIHSDYGITDTSYSYIPELGLIFPGEGKNRVNFCRFHNETHIPARVGIEHYPVAARIKIYVFGIVGGRDVWAVLDNRYVQKISHYAYALPLLRAYGVKVYHEWPKDFPALNVLLQNALYCSDDDVFFKKAIDICSVKTELHKMKEKKVKEDEYVRCCLLNLPLLGKYTYMIRLFMTLIVIVITCLCFRGGIIGEVFLFLFLSLLSMFVTMVVPVFKVRRKYLDDF